MYAVPKVDTRASSDSLLGNPGHDLTVRVAPHVARHPPEELALGLRGREHVDKPRLEQLVQLLDGELRDTLVPRSRPHHGGRSARVLGRACPAPDPPDAEEKPVGPGTTTHEEKVRRAHHEGRRASSCTCHGRTSASSCAVRWVPPSSPLCTRLLRDLQSLLLGSKHQLTIQADDPRAIQNISGEGRFLILVAGGVGEGGTERG